MVTAPEAPEEALLLTIKETARRLKTSPSTVYRLVAEKTLRSVRLRRTIRIPAAALTEFIDGR